jgi:hypothetical protein
VVGALAAGEPGGVAVEMAEQVEEVGFRLARRQGHRLEINAALFAESATRSVLSKA